MLVLRISNLLFLNHELPVLITENTEMWKEENKDTHSLRSSFQSHCIFKIKWRWILMKIRLQSRHNEPGGGEEVGREKQNRWGGAVNKCSPGKPEAHVQLHFTRKQSLKEWLRGPALGISKLLTRGLQKIQYSKRSFGVCPFYKKLPGFPFLKWSKPKGRPISFTSNANRSSNGEWAKGTLFLIVTMQSVI